MTKYCKEKGVASILQALTCHGRLWYIRSNSNDNKVCALYFDLAAEFA